jgi:hypothetical protein
MTSILVTVLPGDLLPRTSNSKLSKNELIVPGSVPVVFGCFDLSTLEGGDSSVA